MNKELFIVFLFLLFIFLLYENKEGVRNPLVPPEYEFSILTPTQDIMSGYFQEELCRNDKEWKSGDKKCHHILNKADCNLKSSNGIPANDACLISCDTCPSSVTIKLRENDEDDNIEYIDPNEGEEEAPLAYDMFDIMNEIENQIDKINLKFKNSDLFIIDSPTPANDQLTVAKQKLKYYNEQVGNIDEPGGGGARQRERFLRTYYVERQEDILDEMCEELNIIEELTRGQPTIDPEILTIKGTTRSILNSIQDHTCALPLPNSGTPPTNSDTEDG